MNRDYRQSRYILTGLGDYSELSSSKGYMALQERGIAIQLEIISIFHRYPNFLNHFGEIRRWIIQKRSQIMPYINVRVAGKLSREQKEEGIIDITKTMERVAGKPPAATYYY